MTTKQEYTDKVNTDLASGSNITAAEHRSVHTGTNGILDVVYPDSIEDTDQTTNIVTSSSSIIYQSFFQKVGGLVSVNGFIINMTNAPLSSPSIFNITNQTYQQQTGRAYNSIGTSSVSNSSARLILSNNTFSFFGTIGVGERVWFNLNYTTAS